MVAVVVVAAVALSAVGPPVAAQSGGVPTAVVESATITVEAGEVRRVVATYRIGVRGGDAAAESLSTVPGTMWRFPGREVRNLSAAVDGTAVEPSVTRAERHSRIRVPIPDASRGDVVTIRMSYRVSSPDGGLRTPLWVPDVEPPGTGEVVRLTVTLPESRQGTIGTTVPAVDSVSEDGRVLDYRLLYVPGSVTVEYGRQGRVPALDTLLTGAGATIVAGFFGAWGLFARRAAGEVDGG